LGIVEILCGRTSRVYQWSYPSSVYSYRRCYLCSRSEKDTHSLARDDCSSKFF
jgi:hypothetical protein